VRRTASEPMRNRPLHAALAAFAEEAAWQLAAVIADGVEVPFEVVEERGSRRDTPLYCYRPLTQRFVTERVGILTRLPSYPAAAHALSREDGLGDYLRAQGETRVPVEARARADAGLRVFVSRIFSDATEFVLTKERFDRAWRELESVLHAGQESLIVAPVLGLVLASEELPMGDGLTLMQPEALDDPPADAVRIAGEDGSLAVVAHTDRPGAPGAVSTAASRLGRMLRGVRLFDVTTPALAGVAWSRTGTGPWALTTLHGGAGARGVLFVPTAAEDELRAFCSLVDRRAPRSGEIAWALARHGMGCDRASALEALSDHLLALRALLEPEGVASGRLGGRLAVLCAEPAQRDAVSAEVAQAVALERSTMAGLGAAPEGTDALVQRMAEYLRALLRDVLCGHLEPDLRALADRLIAAGTAAAAPGP
jgi:hypothetical protein